jgi:signal transduction histidine kinase
MLRLKSPVEAHQGQVAVASQPGAGSEFTVRLPKNSQPAAV